MGAQNYSSPWGGAIWPPPVIFNTKDYWDLKISMDMKEGLPEHFQSAKFKSQYFETLQRRLYEKGQGGNLKVT